MHLRALNALKRQPRELRQLESTRADGRRVDRSAPPIGAFTMNGADPIGAH